MDVKPVDKDLLEGFALWQKNTYDMHRDNVYLKQEIETLQKELEKRSEEREKNAKCLQETNEAVARLQEILSVRCDMEDENRQLQREILGYKNKLLEKEEIHQTEVESLHKEREDLKLELKAELQKARDDILKKAEEEKEFLKKRISERTNELELQEEKIRQRDMDHQAEIMRLRFEYDTKMLKLQKQNTHNHHSCQPAGSNQDIFRKKLQHVRAEADKEVSSLKRRISELEQQLKHSTDKSHQQQGPPLGHNAKRIRRF